MGKKEKKTTIKAKIKTELGFMKEGAKILPSVLAKKGKAWVQSQVQAARERAKIEREIETAAKAAEREAYKVESIKQAKIRGAARGKKGTKGWRATMRDVGAIGDSISLGGVLGLPTDKKPERVVRRSEVQRLAGISSSSYIMSGLGEKKKPSEDLVEGFEVESVRLRRKKRKKKG